MLKAAGGAMIPQFANGLVMHGNPLDALGELAKPDNLRATFIAAATAGVMGHFGIVPPAAGCTDLVAQGKYALYHAAVRTPIEMVVSRRDPVDIVASNLRGALAATVANTLTSHIGQGMHPAGGEPPRFDVVTHKILHGIVGAGSAAIAGNDPLSGATGAVVGEIAGEIYRMGAMGELTPGTHAWDRAANLGSGIAQMVAAVSAMGLNLDADTAADAAGTAAENNAFHPWALDKNLRHIQPLGGGAGGGGFTSSTGRAGSVGMQGTVNVPGGGPIRTTHATVTPKGAPKAPSPASSSTSASSSSGPSTPASSSTSGASRSTPMTQERWESIRAPRSAEKPIHQMGTREYLTEVATRAERKIGGTGAVAGTKKHAYAKTLAERHDRLYGKHQGSRGLELEAPYKGGELLRRGDSSSGSVRLDVHHKATKQVYDYKFVQNPGKGLRSAQVRKIKAQGPKGLKDVIEINPRKLTKD